MATISDQLFGLAGDFATVLQTDPISAVLVICGFALVFAASQVLGLLALGAIVDLFMPDSSEQTPRQGA
ncbi:MAG: hypothetical protein ABEJ48_07750 [Halobacteriales archaeon]